MKDCVCPLSTRGKSVKDDWRAWLPEAKALVFNQQVHELESSYVMLSVSLDEAIELEQMGQPGKSQQAVGITSGLCRLLTQMLSGLLRALSEHAKHYGTVPNAAPQFSRATGPALGSHEQPAQSCVAIPSAPVPP